MATIRETLIIDDRATPALMSVGRAAGTASAAILAAGSAALALGQRFADAVNDLGDFGTRVGIATETVAGLKLAIEGAGGSIGEMEGPLRGAQARLVAAERGSQEARRGFEALGVAWSDGAGKARSLDDVLRDASRSLAAIDDPARRAQAGMLALGEGSGRLMQALGGQELDAFVTRASEFGLDVGPRATAAAGAWQREMADLSLVMQPMSVALMEIGTSAVQSFTLGTVYAGEFARVLGADLLATIQQIPADIMATPAWAFLATFFRDPAALFTGPGVIQRAIVAGQTAASVAREPMDPDAALEVMFGPSFGDRLGVAMAQATEQARAFAAGRIGASAPGGGGAPGAGAPGAGGDPFAGLRAFAAEGNAANTGALEQTLDANLALMAQHADAMNAEQYRIADGARMAATQMRDAYASTFVSILGAAQGFAGESLALHVALGLAQVAVSTSIGVMRAIEQYGPTPLGAVAAAGVVAMGIGQAASIASAALGRGPGGAGSASFSAPGMRAPDAVFAPGSDAGEASTGGGSTRSREQVLRVRSVGGWASQRDLEDELSRVGLALRFEGA